MKTIDGYYFYEIFNFNAHNQLNVLVYRDILIESIFVPCPTGWGNADSFRLYEALESGCIPIVETRYDYFESLYPGHPLIAIDSWEKAPALIRSYLADPYRLEQKRVECYEWWLNYKEDLKSMIAQIVNEHFS